MPKLDDTVHPSLLTAKTADAYAFELQSAEQETLSAYTQLFGNKDFMRHQEEGLPSFPLFTAYKNEEDNFKKTVKMVHVSKVPQDENIMTSHVMYKVKNTDDDSKIMKAGIAPHGNKNKEKSNPKIDSSTFPPYSTGGLISLACIFKWFFG